MYNIIDFITNKLKKITLKKMVEEGLREFLPARNSDESLAKYIFRKWYKDLLFELDGAYHIPINNLLKFPSMSSISRARRLIQNKKHKFPPTIDKIMKLRKKNI